MSNYLTDEYIREHGDGLHALNPEIARQWGKEILLLRRRASARLPLPLREAVRRDELKWCCLECEGTGDANWNDVTKESAPCTHCDGTGHVR